MATNPVKHRETLVDPSFLIPDGVTELTYDESDLTNSDHTADDIVDADLEPSIYDSSDSDLLVNDYDSYDEADGSLEVPDNFTIISQTIRTAPGGMQVVDVVAEVDDVAGDVKYEYRISKI